MEGSDDMKILWVCGLPDDVRRFGAEREISPVKTASWSWILGHLPPPDGVELHIVCLVRGLVDSRVDIDHLGAHWHCFRMLRGEQYVFRVPVLLKIRAFTKLLKPDVIDGWGGETGCGWITTWIAKKSVVNVQGLLKLFQSQMVANRLSLKNGRWLDRIMRSFVERLTYCRATLLCVESNLSHDALKSFYGHESRIVYQPLRPEFLAVSEREQILHPPAFLFVGEFGSRKGAVDTLRAFAQMKCPDATLTMVGGGDQRDELKRFVDENSLGDRVRFLGGLSANELIGLMGRSDFFILPSYGDTGPTALKEALSQGLYPICYDNTGPKELIERYGFGCACETGKWEKLTEAMDAACARREELSRKGEEVSRLIRYDLSPQVIWPKRLEIYREVFHA